MARAPDSWRVWRWAWSRSQPAPLLRGDPWLPFDFAAAIMVGPEALAPAFPLVASLTLGP